MQFESTISIGNILTAFGLLLAAGAWWRAHKSSEKAAETYQLDMEWRVKNLEVWRHEHMVDADARDELIATMGDILKHVRWQTDFMWEGRKAGDPPKGD